MRIRDPLMRAERRFVALGAASAVLAVALITVVAVVLAGWVGAEFSDLSRDPAAVADLPPYIGYYATGTLLVWWAAAAVALFTALILRHAGRAEASRMLLLAGLLTTVMVADDGFQGHETLRMGLGVPDELVTAFYALATVWFAWRYRHGLGLARLGLVAAAFGCWGVSTVIDKLLVGNAPFVVEDGAKLVGVALWTLMIGRLSFVELVGASGSGSESGSGSDTRARHRAHSTVGGRAPSGPGA